MTEITTPPRRRDAVRTRQALLDAAQERFGANGYTRTTLREIGDQAGVDPALIARYFGSKAALFIESLGAGEHPTLPERRVLDELGIVALVERIDRLGPSPVLRAAVEEAEDPGMQLAARRILDERTVGPLEDRAVASELDHTRLRAEVAAAAFAGVMLARSAGTFEALGDADRDTVAELINALLGPVLDGADQGSGQS